MSSGRCHGSLEDGKVDGHEDGSGHESKNQRVQNLVFILIVVGILGFLVSGSVIPYFLTDEPKDVSMDEGQAVVYYNEACGECTLYIKDELIPSLLAGGISDIVKKDYINVRSYRGELNSLNEKMGIPSHLQSHIATFVRKNVTIVLEGHVPLHVVNDLLENSSDLDVDRILVYQEEMKDPESYHAWAFEGEAQEYPIATPISDYLLWFSLNVGTSPKEKEKSLLPLVIATGFLDGLNPCAFAVLLFFISFLFVIRKTRVNVMRMGIVYVLAIFLVYFFIGVGLLQAILLSGQPHLLGMVGSALLILLGSLSILQYFFPNLPLSFKMPKGTWERVKSWIFKATLPSALVAGLLVGLCTFPCSGGIYVAVLALLGSKGTYFEGIGYLYIYNLMFVLPLLIILVTTSNRFIARKLTDWERSKSGIIRLFSGITMIAIALAILLFLV
ncbi:MAG: cytochrome c biogenesis CcdA family protein [Thermoplasmata archaeon]